MVKRNIDIIFLSSLLLDRHPELCTALEVALGLTENCFIRYLFGTRDIWCRDCMPVQVDVNTYVQFIYNPPYLQHSPELRTDFAEVSQANALPEMKALKNVPLVLDGGNIELSPPSSSRMLLTTERIYTDNPHFTPAKIRELLLQGLEVDKVIVLPVFDRDVLGHVDGLARFAADGSVYVSDMERYRPAYFKKVVTAIETEELQVVRYPYYETNFVGKDGIPSAKGCYINFLRLPQSNRIWTPIFGQLQLERSVERLLEIHEGCAHENIIRIPCRDLAKEGGVLNCISAVYTENVSAREAQKPPEATTDEVEIIEAPKKKPVKLSMQSKNSQHKKLTQTAKVVPLKTYVSHETRYSESKLEIIKMIDRFENEVFSAAVSLATLGTWRTWAEQVGIGSYFEFEDKMLRECNDPNVQHLMDLYSSVIRALKLLK